MNHTNPLEEILNRFRDQIQSGIDEPLKAGELTYQEQAIKALTLYLNQQIEEAVKLELKKVYISIKPDLTAHLNKIDDRIAQLREGKNEKN